MTFIQNPNESELKANRLAWIEALESGRFRQTKGTLRRESETQVSNPIGFCCLGVACEISQAGEWHGSEYHIGELPDNFDSECDEQSNYINIGDGELPSNFRQLVLQLTAEEEIKLIDMNDKEEKNFHEIAEYLRTLWNLPREVRNDSR